MARPSSFTSTDATDTFDDKMEYVLGKVYERDKTKVTPDSGSTTTTEYTNNDFYQYTDVGGTTHAWDENGQLTDNGDWAFDWTALGQLAKATPDTGTAREYLYDAFGRRVETKVGSAVSKYIYAGWHMVGEHDGTDWLWQEVPLTGEGMLEHVALDTNDLDGDQDTDEYRGYAVHEDFQDTVWGLSDTAGAIVERYRYREPYGDNYAEDGQGNGLGDFASNVYQAKRLHGGVVDDTTELLDMRVSWIQPLLGLGVGQIRGLASSRPNPYAQMHCNPLLRSGVPSAGGANTYHSFGQGGEPYGPPPPPRPYPYPGPGKAPLGPHPPVDFCSCLGCTLDATVPWGCTCSTEACRCLYEDQLLSSSFRERVFWREIIDMCEHSFGNSPAAMCVRGCLRTLPTEPVAYIKRHKECYRFCGLPYPWAAMEGLIRKAQREAWRSGFGDEIIDWLRDKGLPLPPWPPPWFG